MCGPNWNPSPVIGGFGGITNIGSPLGNQIGGPCIDPFYVNPVRRDMIGVPYDNNMPHSAFSGPSLFRQPISPPPIRLGTLNRNPTFFPNSPETPSLRVFDAPQIITPSSTIREILQHKEPPTMVSKLRSNPLHGSLGFITPKSLPVYTSPSLPTLNNDIHTAYHTINLCDKPWLYYGIPTYLQTLIKSF